MTELVELAKRCELQQDEASDNMERIWSQGTEHSAWETMAAYARRLARIAYDYAIATKITNDNDNEDDEDNQDWPL
jgi:hypothetical protein